MFKDFERDRQTERQQSGLGSGFIIKENGIVITNNHVIAGADDILVTVNSKEYKAKVIESNDNGFKDEFVLILISLPILILGYSVFSDDLEIRNKLELFFEYFNQLPYWYQAIFIGVVSAIYGLKGADIMRKK